MRAAVKLLHEWSTGRKKGTAVRKTSFAVQTKIRKPNISFTPATCFFSHIRTISLGERILACHDSAGGNHLFVYFKRGSESSYTCNVYNVDTGKLCTVQQCQTILAVESVGDDGVKFAIARSSGDIDVCTLSTCGDGSGLVCRKSVQLGDYPSQMLYVAPDTLLITLFGNVQLWKGSKLIYKRARQGTRWMKKLTKSTSRACVTIGWIWWHGKREAPYLVL